MGKNAHFAHLSGHALLLGLAALAVLVFVFGDSAADLLRYQRAAIEHGEWWRWLTGHLVHLNLAHLALNLAGVVLCAMLVGEGLRGARGVAVLSGAWLGCSFGLWFFSPAVAWYVGLSGVLHGLLLGGALGLPPAQWRWRWAIGAIVVAKLLSEQLVGAPLSTRHLIGHAVVVDAHLYGAVGGTAGWLLYRIGRALRRNPTHTVSEPTD